MKSNTGRFEIIRYTPSGDDVSKGYRYYDVWFHSKSESPQMIRSYVNRKDRALKFVSRLKKAKMS